MTILSHGHLWSLQLLERCRDSGVKTICIAPGSRSTCLVKAASDIPSIKIMTHYDERSLGFFALGMAKYDRVPVVVITTSGSAVANLVPSATEAHALHIPIIYITADRPPELQGCGANQTIEQLPLLTHLVQKQVSLLVTDDDQEFQQFVKTIHNTITKDITDPIHINMAFREPFLSTKITSLTKPLALSKIKIKQYHDSDTVDHIKNLKQKIQNQSIKNQAVLCVVSNTVKPLDYKKLLLWSHTYHIPIVSECSSSIPWNEPVIRQVDSFVKKLDNKSKLPAYIICLGAKWISKSLQVLLANHTNIILIHDFSITQNWLSLPCLEIMNQTIDLTDILPTQQAKKSYFEMCFQLATEIKKEEQQKNKQSNDFSEVTCLKALKPLMEKMTTIFLGNSLTVRHVNNHLDIQAKPIKTMTQRGVSGIDGLVSTTAGIAVQESQQTMGIIGDISFFYDVGGLSLLRYAKNPVILVVINNKGGQIFNTLAINKDPICNPLFVMPQPIKIQAIATAYCIDYIKVTSIKELKNIKLTNANNKTSYQKSCIIECCINEL